LVLPFFVVLVAVVVAVAVVVTVVVVDVVDVVDVVEGFPSCCLQKKILCLNFLDIFQPTNL
jgi:hypothetical protein